MVDSSTSCSTSSMITASNFDGIGSPVSTHRACEPIFSRRGEVSVAPKVSLDLTATPSMAAES